jgi:hypothetical protein
MPTNAPQTVEEMQATLSQLMPGESAEALRETAAKLMAALAADPASPEARLLWVQIEQATGRDLRAVFQPTESFGASLLRALSEGRLPSVSAPVEAAAGQGENGRVEGFPAAPANADTVAASNQPAGLSDALPADAAPPQLQSTVASPFTQGTSSITSGGTTSSVQVSQASGLNSLGVGTELSNAALVTPFVLQTVSPDGQLLQSLDSRGLTTGLSEGSHNPVLSQGTGGRVGTVAFAPPPAPAPAAPQASNPPAPPLEVDSIIVNEGSPYAVFTVLGTPGQIMRLALGNTGAAGDAPAVLGTDTGNAGTGVALQVYNGSQWVDYAPGSFASVPVGSQVLLVRTRLVQDGLHEGPRTFTLTATNVDGLASTGKATLLDDGRGDLFPDARPGPDGGPALDTAGERDDDRPRMTLEGVDHVSEGSFAVATLHLDRPLLRSTEVELALAHEDTEAGDIGTTLVVFTDPADPEGSTLTLANGRFTLPTGITAVYVRVATGTDGVYEGPESFRLSAAFTDPVLRYVDAEAANPVLRPGAATTDTSTVVDDGSGRAYGPGGLPVVDNPASTDVDESLPTDQRPVLAVVGVDDVSEGSPAVFAVTMNRPAEHPVDIELALAHEGTEPGDIGTTLVVFTNPADPEGSALTVTNGRITLPAGVTGVYVRVATGTDGVYEGPESFRLTAGFTDPVLKFADPAAADPVARDGATATDTSTVTDDGSGRVFGPGGLPVPAAQPTDQRPVLSVAGVDDVSEGSPAVFSLALNRPCEQPTEIALALSHEGTEPGDFDPALVVFTDPADPEGSALTVTNGRFTLPPGVTAVHVRVATGTDGVYEGPENFRLTAGFTDPVLKFVDPQAATPVARSGATATDTSTVTDDSFGRVYGPGGLPVVDTLPVDQRPVLSLAGKDDVSEGSPAVFALTLDRPSEQPTEIALALGHESTEAGDYDTTLVVFTDPADPTGSALTVSNGRFTLPAGVTAVHVRVATNADAVYEGPESFRLTAAFTDPMLKFVDLNAATPVARSGATATDTSTVTDDSFGRVYGPGGLPVVESLATDQRPVLNVAGVDDVSEGSPAVFAVTLDRASEHATEIDLALSHEGTEPGDIDTTLVVFTNPADPTGSVLTVTNGRVTLPAGVTAVYVRVATSTDAVYEGPESFRLTAGFTDPMLKFVDPDAATPVARSGATATDTSTVTDDGSGRVFGPGGLPVPAAQPTDQRPVLSVAGVDDVSEGSPAVFSLALNRPCEQPTEIALALSHDGTEPGDFDPALVVFTDPADPVGSALVVTNGRFTLPAGVTSVHVRVATNTDGVYEGPESFRLTAGFTDPVLKFVDPDAATPVARSGATATDTSTVTDDSFGRVYGPGGLVVDAAATDQRPTLSLAGVDDVSEGSPAVFALTLDIPSEQPTEIALALGHESTEAGDYDTTLVVFTNPADPAGSALTVTNGRFTLPAGVTAVHVRVATSTDGVYEGPESFRLTASFTDPMLKFVDLNAATPVARAGATATDTSTVTDDSFGRVYGSGGLPVLESLATDQRPVLNVAGKDDVSEGSPAVFAVTLDRASEHATELALALSHESTETGDIDTTLVVFTNPADPAGSALTVANGRVTLPAGVTAVYVRVATSTDAVYEGPESFRLTAGFTDPMLQFVDPDAATPVARSGATATDTSTVTDDGSGSVYGPGGLPVVESPATDQRPVLSVAGQDDVSEGSPAVFALTLDRASEQPTEIALALSHESTETGDIDTTLVVFTNPADPAGSALTVTNGRFTLPAGVTSVYVRVATSTDGVYEGPESFRLTAGFTDPVLKFVDPAAATPVARSGATATDTSTVTDDGSGSVYGPGGLPVVTAATDQRPALSLAGVDDVSEGSPAVFALTLDIPSEQPTEIALALGHESTEAGDYDTTLVVFTDPADPAGSALTITSGRFTLPAGVTSVYVRVATSTDGVYEGPESFRLTASFTDPVLKFVDPDAATPVARSGATATDTSTVTDDSFGRVYGPGGLPVVDNPATTGVDESLPTDQRPVLNVEGVDDVSEGSPAVFEVSLDLPGEHAIEIDLALSHENTEVGDIDTTLVVFTNPADPAGSALTVTNGRFTLPAGTTVVYARVDSATDAVYEGPESFRLTASFTDPMLKFVDPDAATPVARSGATASDTSTILDDGTGRVYGSGGLPVADDSSTPDVDKSAADDDRPTITVSSPVVNEAAGHAVFSVTLSHLSTQDLRFTPGIASTGSGPGHALPGTDMGASAALEFSTDGGQTWSSASSGVTIAAGTAGLLLRTPVTNEGTPLYEGAETFELHTGAVTVAGTATPAAMRNPAGATGTGTIMDDGTGSVPTGTPPDDDRPTLAVTGTTVLEDAGWALFRVELDRASGLDILFTPSVADGTGTAGTDSGASAAIEYYDSTAATWLSAANGVTIAAGATSVQLRVPVVDDLDDENDETFSLATGAAQGVTNGSGASGSSVIVDNDPSFSFDAQAVTVVEGEAMQFVVHRVSGAGVPVTLDYSVVVASADSSALPVTRSGTVSFSANQTQATITLNSVDDQRITDDQRLYLSLSTTDDDIRVTQGTVSGTVRSNDAEISIRSITASGPDGNGLYTYEVTVERSGALGFTHAVDWSVAGVGENPARNGDFTLPQSQRIEFAANNDPQAASDTQVITFQAAAGLMADGERTFEVRLAEEAGSAARVVLGRDAERGTITPNGAGVTIEAVTTNLAEGSEPGDALTQTFRVNLSQAVGSDVVVAWQVASFASGTAVDADGADFGGSFPGGTVTIAAGQTSALIQLTPSPDSTLEANERFLVDFSVQSGPAGKVGPAVIGRIANDEASVQFAFATFSADEGDTGSNGRFVATVERADSIRNTATVGWHVEAINGVSDADALAWFAAGQNAGSQASGLPSGTLTLQPGAMQGEIALALVGNNAIEAARNFRIVLDNPGTGTALGSRTTATATILDDDARFDMGTATLMHEEGNGGNSTIEVVVTRSGDTRLPASVTWTALGTGAHPINGPDLQPNNAAGTLLFGAGESSATIHVAVRPDDAVEADEQLTVTLTGTSTAHHVLGSNVTTVVTLNNDDASVAFDAGMANLLQTHDEDGAGPGHEGAVFQFQVTRSGDARSAVSVPWTIPLSGSLTSADFVATSGTVDFAAGSSTATLTVTAVNDRVVEGDETFTVQLAPTAGSGISLGLQDTATGVLTNDDVAIQAVLVAAPTEGANGSDSTYTFTLTRTGDVARQASDIDWSVAGSAVTQAGVTYAAALGAGEFSGSTSGSLSWFAGDSSSRTVTVTVANDSTIEGDEAFALGLASQAGDRSQLTADGTVAIVHDDDAQVSITRLSADSVTEGAAGSSQTVSFRVARSGDLASTLTVDLTASGVAGASGPTSVTFSPQSGSATITLANGQTQTLALQGGDQYVDVSYVLPGDDTAQGNRSFSVALSNPQATRSTGTADAVGIDNTAASAAVAVTDDDDRITVTPSQSSITEGNSGSTALTFTLTRSGVTGKETVVNWRIGGGSGVAVSANDFTVGQEDVQVPNGGLPSGRVTFAAGETSKVITVNVSGDTRIEADESLLLNLAVVAGNSELPSTAVTVLTDDAGYNVIARNTSMAEGNDPATPRYVTFELVRSGVAGSSSIDWELDGISSGDIEDIDIDGVSVGTGQSGTVSFANGQTGAVLRVRLVQDQVAESSEVAVLTLIDPADGGTPVAAASTVITNDDASLSISAGQASVSEGTDADLERVAAGNTQTFDITYTVARTGYLAQTSTVNWAVLAQNGVDAADFADGVLPSGSLTFTSGQASKTITVSVRRDWAGEASEGVVVQLSSASPGTRLVTASATTTVTDDDSSIGFAGYTTEGTALAVAEGDDNSGWVDFTFTVQRSGSNVREQEVAWRVVTDPDSGITLADFHDTYTVPGVDGGDPTPTLPYGTVTFAAGDASSTKTVTIRVKSDTFAAASGWPTVASTLEADEPFRVELYNPLEGDAHIGYTVPEAASVAHAVIVNDDVRIQVTDIRTGFSEGRDPAANGGDADAFQPGVQRWITQSVTVKRMGDPSQAVSLQWFIDTPGLADRLVLADGSGNLPDGTFGVADGTSAAGIASGSYTAGSTVDGVSQGVLSGLLSWAAGDTADKVLYFTAIPNDDPEPDFRFVLKARPNPGAAAESTRIDEVSVGEGADNYNAIMGANAPLVLANLVVRRDEAELWISNAVHRPYDAATSSYRSDDDAIFGVQSFRADRDLGQLVAQGDESMGEGTVIAAQAGTDYTAASSTLSFSEAERSRIVSVNLRNDGTAEPRETFSLFLNNASGAGIAGSQANVTVIDGDGGGNEYRVAVNDATAIEGVDSHAQFRVDFGKPLSQANVFELTIDGTAYQDAAGGVTADYFRYLQFSADGGLNWQNTAPTFGFNLAASTAAAQDATYHAVFNFDNSEAAARYDAWMDFGDLAAGQGYEVGGNAANLTFAGAAPPPLDTSGRLYVVVEADGAWVDTDNDGIHDASETTLAFDPNDLIVSNTAQPVWRDLIGLSSYSVTIQWNALPSFGGGNSNALDLRGFGNDDKIEIDLRALAVLDQPVGVDNLVQTPSAYEGSPGHPAWYQRRSDIEATATRDGVSYTTTLEGLRDAYGDFAPTDHRLTLQMGSNAKITLGYFGEGYGPQSGALANPNFNANVSNGLLDQMSFVTPVSTPRGDVWIPVRADAVLDLQALGVGFGRAETAETLRGAFAGVADLAGAGTLNDEALDFFRNLVHDDNATLADIQDYFNQYDPSNILPDGVKFLKFTIDWDGTGTPTWQINGLDPSVVVAPQNGDWEQLRIHQAVTVEAGATSADAGIRLGAGAAFSTDHAGLASSGAVPGATVTATGLADWDGTITVGPGADSILVRTGLVDDRIDEIVEHLDVSVRQVSGDTFAGNYDSGRVDIVDNDSPQIGVGTAVVRDSSRRVDYLTKIIDINNRDGDTPDLRTVLANGTLLYVSDSQLHNMGAGQSFTVAVRYQGQWEVAALSEILETSVDPSYDASFGAPAPTGAQHSSPPPFAALNGVAEVVEGQPTGFYIAQVTVPAGTYQLLLRSEVETIARVLGGNEQYEVADLSDAEQARADSFTAVVGHVDPVIVARHLSVVEADGRAQVEVIAVGGDFADGPATVDVATADGAWVEKTFVVVRELSTKGEITVTWALDAAGALPEGVGAGDYVDGYYGHTAITPADAADFIALDGQVATGGGVKGRVTFAEGQKEATITVRVRSDDLIEAIKDYRVTITGEVVDGVEVPATRTVVNGLAQFESQSFQVIGNPEDGGHTPGHSSTYEGVFESAGYGRINNDDRAFSIKGFVFNESRHNVAVAGEASFSAADSHGVAFGTLGAQPTLQQEQALLQQAGLVAPDGYTLHQFVIDLEGDAPGAASVQWRLYATGIDGSGGFSVGTQTITNGAAAQAAGAHQAETADFLAYDAGTDGAYSSAYGFQWEAAGGGGMVSLPKTVRFADGQKQAVVTVAVRNDLLAEDAEQFRIELLNPQALEGSNSAVDVHPLRGDASFLMGDDDGATVKVAFGWMAADDPTLQSLQRLDGANVSLDEGSGSFYGAGAPGSSGWELKSSADWLAAGGYPGTDNHTADDKRVVMIFTRSNADLDTASQAFFEVRQASATDAVGFTLESGNVRAASQAEGVWRGIVDFAAGETEAYVVLRLHDDLIVDPENALTVTLYDAESLPTNERNTEEALAATAGWDAAGIGASGALADWNLSRRDPDAYQATLNIVDDDVRLWARPFTLPDLTTYSYDHDGNAGTPQLTLDNYDQRLRASEGDPAWPGAADQHAANAANGDFSFNLYRQGAGAGTVSMAWSVVLSGSADAADFNAALFDLDATYVNGDGDTVLVGRDPLTLNAGGATALGVSTHTVAGLFASDFTIEADKTFDFVLGTPVSSTGARVLFSPSPGGELDPPTTVPLGTHVGLPSLTLGVTLANDDVRYEIAWNAANPVVSGPLEVLEGDASDALPGVVSFDVTRELGGYTAGSTVGWRVVAINGSAITPADFHNTFVDGTGQVVLPHGVVQFAGRMVDGSNVETAAAELTKTVELAIKGDSAVEFGEHFRIELYNPSVGFVDQSANSLDAVIVNDDTGLRVENTSIREQDSGDQAVTVTITRVGDLVRANKATVTTSFDWTAVDLDTNAEDHGTGAYSGSGVQLAANPGATHTYGYAEETTTITFNTKGDATVEEDEALRVLLSNVQGIDEVLNGGTGTATIRNDDTVFSVVATPGFEAANQAVVEDAGGTYHFRITRSVATPQDQTVTWSAVAAGGRNVVDAADFGGTLPSGTVTFAAGELVKDITFSGVSADGTSEADQVFQVEVTGFGTGAENDTFAATGSGATGTIVNDDQAVFISDSLPVTQAEGTASDVRTYRFEVVRSGSTVPVTCTVDWALDFTGTGADASDFTGPTSGTLTFTQDGAQVVEITIAADAVAETALQDFNITLGNGSGGVQILTPSVQGILGDDDYTLSVADASVSEGDGNNQITFTVTRTGSTVLPAVVAWSLDFAGRTASAADFRDISDSNAGDGTISGSFTLPAGVSSYTFSVPIQGDTQWEDDETFNLALDYGVGTASAVGTLSNDDEGFSVAAITPVAENAGPITFRVVREGNLSGGSTVDWSLAGSGANPATTSGNGNGNDFAGALSGTVTFADGESFKDVSIALAGDTAWEADEGFTVTLANPGVGSSLKSQEGSSASSQILNDDQGWFVAASTAEVTEDQDGNTVTFTITRSLTSEAGAVVWTLSNPSGDATAVTLADLLVDGQAATSGATSGTTLNFAIGEASKTVTVALAGDAAMEAAAQLRMTLTRAAGDSTSNLVTPTANVAVVDDDERLALVTLSTAAVAEGGGGGAGGTLQFKVTREGSSIGAASATWTLAGSGDHPIDASDIERIEIDGVAQAAGAMTGTLTFADGSLADRLVTVVLRGDAAGEFDEGLTLKLSEPGAGTSLGNASAAHTVLNDDPAVQLLMPVTEVLEGNEGADRAFTFQVQRSGDLSQAGTVVWNLLAAASGNSVDAADFGGTLPSGLVTFQAGEASKTVTVVTTGDETWEPNEGFRIALSQASAGLTIIGAPEVAGLLKNDDVQVTIAANSATVREYHANQYPGAYFTLSAQGLASASSVLVSWHVEGTGLNPASAADFAGNVLPSGQTSITLVNGSGSATPGVTIAGDNIYGPSEQFKVVIDSVIAYSGNTVVGGGTATTPSTTITVLDDDLLIGLSQAEAHAYLEGDTGTTTMRFYVDQIARSADAATMADVRVNYHLSGDLDGSDVANATGSNVALTLDNDSGRYYIGVTLNGDAAVEGTERFTLHLDAANVNGGGGVEIAQSGATVAGRVLDDDFGIELVSAGSSQSEDGARFVFDVLRTGPTDEAMTVQWTLGNPSLVQGEWGVSANDFIDPATGQPYTTTAGTPITGTLSFAAGEGTARFTLEAGHDALPEGDERFAVQVAVASVDGQALTAQVHQVDTGTGTIVNDDPLPQGFDPAVDQQVHLPLEVLA